MDRSTDICLISVPLFRSLFYFDHRQNHPAEVVHCHMRRDLLLNMFCFSRMKCRHTHRVLQIPEGSFDSPSHGVQPIDLFRWKTVLGKIRKDSFIGIFRYREPHYSERYLVEAGRGTVFLTFGQEIKNRVFYKQSVMLFVFQQLSGLIALFPCKRECRMPVR